MRLCRMPAAAIHDNVEIACEAMIGTIANAEPPTFMPSELCMSRGNSPAFSRSRPRCGHRQPYAAPRSAARHAAQPRAVPQNAAATCLPSTGQAQLGRHFIVLTAFRAGQHDPGSQSQHRAVFRRIVSDVSSARSSSLNVREASCSTVRSSVAAAASILAQRRESTIANL